MLESVCLIALIAALLLVSVSRYRADRQANTLSLARSDVQLLSQALRAYVREQGCYADQSEQRGYFAGNTTPSVSDLGGTDKSLPLSRQPLIQRYECVVKDTLNPADTGPRVYHRLLIKAELASRYRKQSESLAVALGAQSVPDEPGMVSWEVPLLDPQSIQQSARQLSFGRHVQTQETAHALPSFSACWLGAVS